MLVFKIYPRYLLFFLARYVPKIRDVQKKKNNGKEATVGNYRMIVAMTLITIHASTKLQIGDRRFKGSQWKFL